MTVNQLAAFLIEAEENQPEEVRVFNDRLLLRFMSSPALIGYLVGSVYGRKDGQPTVQVELNKVPDEVIPQVKELIGVPCKVMRYKKDGFDRVGFEIKVPTKGQEEEPELPDKGRLGTNMHGQSQSSLQ